MAIPEPFLDELLDRTDIVDLVPESVRLTQKGRNYWGLCPFHSEKPPSPYPLTSASSSALDAAREAAPSIL